MTCERWPSDVRGGRSWPPTSRRTHPPPSSSRTASFRHRRKHSRWGIRKGMRRREAQARCPEVEVLLHDPARDMRALRSRRNHVHRVVLAARGDRPSRVCVFWLRADRPGTSAARKRCASASRTQWTRPSPVVRTHPLHIDDRTRTGIADGPFAAQLAAMQRTRHTTAQKRDFPRAVRRSISWIRPDLCDLLRRLGIRSLGDLAASRANGSSPDSVPTARSPIALPQETTHGLLEPRQVPPDLSVVRELEHPAHRVDIAMFAGKSAADELAIKLGGARVGVRQARDRYRDRARRRAHTSVAILVGLHAGGHRRARALAAGRVAARTRSSDGWYRDHPPAARGCRSGHGNQGRFLEPARRSQRSRAPFDRARAGIARTARRATSDAFRRTSSERASEPRPLGRSG